MASFYHLLCDATHTITHIIEKDRECVQDRSRYHFAALLIQRNYRGYLARKEIRTWHEAATVLQKYIRRFLVKINMANYMLAYLENQAMRFYNKMATRIQTIWRGYICRKNGCDFMKLFEERKRIRQINDEMRDRMRREKLRALELEKLKVEQEAQSMVLFILFKLHHLLRTDWEGIYSTHGSSKLSWIEKLLKSIKFKDYMKALRKLYEETYKEPEDKPCILKGRWRECEKAYYKRDKRNDLNPGPPPNPNEFLHEKRFCMDPRVVKRYEKLLLTQGNFVPKITDILREFNNELNISETEFDNSQRMIAIKSKYPPYYPDFWNRICEIHNFVDM